MKKIISLILAIVSVLSVFALCSCTDNSDEKSEGSKENQNVVIGEGDNALSVDEGTIKDLLSAYPQKALGMKKTIYDYDLKLSESKLEKQGAVKIEAYLDGAEKPEKTFMFLGAQFYIYDAKKEKYLKLTVNGPVEDTTKKAETTAKVLTKEEVEEENNSVLHKRYKNYDLSVVNLPADINEYEFLVTGTSAKASDGKDVYVINLLDKSGNDTGIRFAVNDDADYYFNKEKDTYMKLK